MMLYVVRMRERGRPLSLPELMDCQLHSMSHNAFVLSGLEEIDGVTYAQV